MTLDEARASIGLLVVYRLKGQPPDQGVITSVTDFQQQLAIFRPGQRVTLTINRDQELKLIELRIP